MHKLHKYWMIVGIVLIFSLLGTSAASARTEVSQKKITFSVVSFGGLNAPKMAWEPNFTSRESQFVREDFCTKHTNCFGSTGRYLITYLRKSEGHWITKCLLYVPDFIDNDQDAKKWRWSAEYIADHCSLPDEPQTWEGIYINLKKEMVPVECKQTCEVAT
jgi:hypothetical protein